MNLFIQPTGSRIIVEVDEPDNVEPYDTTSIGTIRTLGQDVRNLEVGDRVAFHCEAGQGLVRDGKWYRILRPKHIVATL